MGINGGCSLLDWMKHFVSSGNANQVGWANWGHFMGNRIHLALGRERRTLRLGFGVEKCAEIDDFGRPQFRAADAVLLAGIAEFPSIPRVFPTIPSSMCQLRE